MATDFEAEGLLDGLDGDEREARRRLLEELEAVGLSLGELRDAVSGGRLALLPLERELTPPGRSLTFEEVVAESGLDAGFLGALIRALGLPQPPDGEPTLTELDVEAAQIVSFLRAAGVPDEPLLEATRVLGRSLSQFVTAVRAILGEAFFKPGDTEYDIATRWSAAARDLNPHLDRIVLYVLRAQQIAQLRQDVIDLAGMSAGAETSAVSVAFADLAGFTRLGEQVPAGRLGAIAGRLTALATEAAVPPVRLVKMIGDAAMLVSFEPQPLLESVLDLVEAADLEGEDFPQLRAGVACGAALARAGDWFGRPVNLASRITDRARPGSVVATAEFRELIGEDGFTWSRLPRVRRMKGISGEPELYRVRRPEAAN
jgi:adenylate cyclase